MYSEARIWTSTNSTRTLLQYKCTLVSTIHLLLYYVVVIIYSARSLVIVFYINCRYLSVVISPGSLCIRYVKITITNDN